MTEQTFEEKLNQFLAIVKQAGIKTYRNRMACCRTCASVEVPGYETSQPIIWTFGGQGMAVSVKGNEVKYRAGGAPAAELYFNHVNLREEDKYEIINAIRRAGLDSEWAGQDELTITIKTGAGL